MPFMVKISQAPVSVEFEAGSIGEATAILSNNATALAAMFAVDVGAVPAAEPAKRGRPRTKNQPDPATAQAPPPASVPDAYTAGILAKATPVPAAPPPATAGQTLEIPDYLRRAPVPPLANAPPVAPPAPPAAGSPLAGKVIEEVKRRVTGLPDGGKAMVDWLVQCNIVVSGATFDEAIACIPFVAPDKLAPVAAQLGVQ